MAGGTWVSQNKIRPGVYINFRSAPAPVGTLGERGTVTMALPLSWGPSKQVIQIESGQDTRDLLGYDITAPELLLVREALKRARTLLLYRLNSGTQATATIGSLTVTAKYPGSRGNDITIVIQPNVDNETLMDVITMVDGREVDRQTVATAEELQANAWVTFAGSGALTETAGTVLTGGTDGEVTNGDHSDYLAEIEKWEFNTMALVSQDVTLKQLYEAFVRRLRDDEGRKIQVVMETYPGGDYEGVIKVKNGVILADGTALTAAQATAWFAGATAGAAINQSLTYQAYDGAVDANPRLTHTETVAALQAGEIVFTHMGGKAVVEQDINSFVSFTPEKREHFRKNRVIRVLDAIANDIKRIYEASYVGKVDNNADGRNLFKAEIISYLESLQAIGAIQNFDPQIDVAVEPGSASDAVLVTCYVQPVDAVEKIYMSVEVA
ncbi:MAG: phage tail sheath family protein [Limnochordales bacterium]